MPETLRVVVSARKGGVGKSAISVLLARWLAAQNYRVLLLDLDPQRTSSSDRLGADIESPLPYTAVDLVLGAKGRPFVPQVIIDGRLDAVASNQRDVAELEYHLRNIHEQRKLGLGPKARRAVLDSRLTAVEVGYDFVVLDTPTYFGEITTNALEAAHLILSPFNTKATQDTPSILDLVEHLEALSRQPPVLFIPNLWDSRKGECRRSLALAQELVGDKVLAEAILPEVTEVVAAFAEHRDIAVKDQRAAVLAERLWKLGQRVIRARNEKGQPEVKGAPPTPPPPPEVPQKIEVPVDLHAAAQVAEAKKVGGA